MLTISDEMSVASQPGLITLRLTPPTTQCHNPSPAAAGKPMHALRVLLSDYASAQHGRHKTRD